MNYWSMKRVRVRVPAVHENLQTLQPPAAVNPVPLILQVCNLDKEQNEPWTDPDNPELLVIVKEPRLEGKDEGRGFERLLESRWSSTRDVKEEIEEGIVPESDVDDRSLEKSVKDTSFV